jgi:flagellar protein FlbD
MIHLTRLNDRPFVLNADLIKLIENAPDTVITLLNGEKLVVKETIDEILARVAAFHRASARRVHSPTFPGDVDRDAEDRAGSAAMAARKGS